MSNGVLCFVEGPWAWFTTGPLADAWGDDWDDAPRAHNAGEPYAWDPRMKSERYTLIKVAFDGPFKPAPDWQTAADINATGRLWIYGDKGGINAGCLLSEFVTFVRKSGGEVYMPCKEEA